MLGRSNLTFTVEGDKIKPVMGSGEGGFRMKKTWVAPVLETYGTVADLTQQTYKDYGAGDGITYQGMPIGNPSEPCNP
jgi:hypothetical protein